MLLSPIAIHKGRAVFRDLARGVSVYDGLTNWYVAPGPRRAASRAYRAALKAAASAAT